MSTLEKDICFFKAKPQRSRTPFDAFDVIVPSIPGFGFSSKPKGKPIGPSAIAALWNKLMTEVLATLVMISFRGRACGGAYRSSSST
jgi:hypothetical protein